MEIGIILLAGGRSQRFGSDKRRAILADGQALLASTIETVQASGLPSLVCLGRDDLVLETELLTSQIACVRCQNSSSGMGGTLADGIRARPPSWRGVLVALADMPWIRPSTFTAIAASLMTGRIVTPVYRGRRGHPVGFGCEFFPLLEELKGDKGGKVIMDTFPCARYELEIDDPGICMDVDRPSNIGGFPRPE